MDTNAAVTIVLYTLCVFAAGWGWGAWWQERAIRRDRASGERGRLNVSMPTVPENAAQMMRLLSDLIEQAERDRLSST